MFKKLGAIVIALTAWCYAVPALGQDVHVWCNNGGSGFNAWSPAAPGTPCPTTQVPSSGSANGLTPSTTAALASNQVVKSGAGNLYGLQVSADTTLSAAPWWIMLFDATSLPSNGSVTPLKCYALPVGATFASYSWADTPIHFATGMTIGVSTSGCFALAASIHAFISGDAK